MRSKLYIAVTADEYELPVYVAGSMQELADMVGISYGTANTYLYSKTRRNGTAHLRYYVVDDYDDAEMDALIWADKNAG